MTTSADTFRIPLGISRVRGEEDDIGHAEIHRPKFVRAITNVLTDFGNRCDRSGWEPRSKLLAEHYERQLTGDMNAWLSRYVEYQVRVKAMTAEEFVKFMEREPWDSALLGVPAVQWQIDRLRRDSKGADRKRLGQWVMGTLTGKPQTHDPDWIRWRGSMTRRHLRELIGTLKRTVSHRRSTAAALKAWTAAKSLHASIVQRIELGNLREDTLRTFADAGVVESIANRLVAFEEDSTESTIRRLSRTRITEAVPPKGTGPTRRKRGPIRDVPVRWTIRELPEADG